MSRKSCRLFRSRTCSNFLVRRASSCRFGDSTKAERALDRPAPSLPLYEARAIFPDRKSPRTFAGHARLTKSSPGRNRRVRRRSEAACPRRACAAGRVRAPAPKARRANLATSCRLLLGVLEPSVQRAERARAGRIAIFRLFRGGDDRRRDYDRSRRGT